MKEAPSLTLSMFHPRHWLTWFGYGVFWLIVQLLPYPLLMKLGRALGRLMQKLLKKRADIADRNLQLCFPQMSDSERQQLVDRNFESAGMAVIETGIAWWWPDWRIQKLCHYEGMENLPKEQGGDQGIVFLSMHFQTLEMGARLYSNTYAGIGFYRPNKNPIIEFFQYRGRSRGKTYLIDKRDIKLAVKQLRKGHRLWYAPDQDYGRRSSIFVPFFAVQDAPTIPATSNLAKLGKAKVMIFVQSRLPNNKGYQLTLSPALDNFPSDDLVADTTRINQLIEAEILKQPEEYMWMHRRFKTRPDPEQPSYY
ncbi:LpxL/LpxP family Kdo(2)-lipid IV(A) lauroyl/palmitoleoyl acyltransferase [Corallincola luteus]|nr:LpxL/LpxP family Kdo(2)-lipid IV(A) lauroyl/palmitoleoyl acyltransferase [Corallincola luteus]